MSGNDSRPSFLIKNLDDYDANYAGGEIFGGANYVAKTAGAHGNNLLVSTCPSATAYSQELASGNSVNGAGAVGDTTITVDDVDLASNVINVGDIIQFSSTAATTDFDDGEFLQSNGVNTGTNVVTFVQHPEVQVV